MTDQLTAEMRKEKQRTKPTPRGRDFIFHSKGRPIPQNTVRRHFTAHLEAAELRKIRFHDIRHTFCSILVSAKIPMIYVKEQAGHKSVKTTMDYYSDYIPGQGRAEVNILDEL